MSKQIHYTDEPLEMQLVPDSLPTPDELALKNQQTKVTISLSSESVANLREAAKKHHMQYQIESIREHYSGEGVPHIGGKFQREIVVPIRYLQSHPGPGRPAPELGTSAIRELVHPHFASLDLRGESSVRIIRVWRSECLLVLPLTAARRAAQYVRH